jgi:uracil-DNA glycosylase family 4
MLDIPGLYDEKENVLSVIKDLSFPCYDCRLGHCQKPKQNRGLVWRGNPKAKIALVSIMPGPKEMESGKPLTGKSGQLSDKWFKYLKMDTNVDMLVINVVQCKPPDVEKDDGEKSQREPELDELAACFPNRCLRILRAMSNLEVVITMGWTAAKCILGGSPTDQSHMGHWYTTSLLPGKAVYCLPHPAALIREEKKPGDAYLEKKYKLIKCLDRLKRQYLDTDKAVTLAKG